MTAFEICLHGTRVPLDMLVGRGQVQETDSALKSAVAHY